MLMQMLGTVSIIIKINISSLYVPFYVPLCLLTEKQKFRIYQQ